MSDKTITLWVLAFWEAKRLQHIFLNIFGKSLHYFLCVGARRSHKFKVNKWNSHSSSCLYCSIFELQAIRCRSDVSELRLKKSNTRTWGYNILICVLSLTGPNSGAGTHYWPSRIHRTVHWHTVLWQVPWTWGTIVLHPVLLWLTSRRRWKQRHGQSCICFFYVLFKAQYFHPVVQ